ncbi:hypothetical protein SANA_31310 [Gottschalkiaceae bacterium SANA]|nr:hypothetical protein SANA_31310 [Gottschalkiaceae bacterium SANA]
MEEVRIQINAEQETDGEVDKMEFNTEAVMFQDGEWTCYRYEETEVMGMAGTITTLKVKEGKIQMIREGELLTQMDFEAGKTSRSNYQTPFGELSLQIDTMSLSYSLDPEGHGKVEIAYKLSIDGTLQSINKLDMAIH